MFILCKYKGKISNNNDLFLKYLFIFLRIVANYTMNNSIFNPQ